MWECADYFIRKEGTSERNTAGYAQIDDFRNHLIESLEDILKNHAPQNSGSSSEKGTAHRLQTIDLFKEEET